LPASIRLVTLKDSASMATTLPAAGAETKTRFWSLVIAQSAPGEGRLIWAWVLVLPAMDTSGSTTLMLGSAFITITW
jgi:hypothetical protein